MKPIFTIHAGEYLVGSEIEKNYPNLRVWIPSKDTGIDLLVTSADCRKSVSLQVKFSKDFLWKSGKGAISKGVKSGGWWTFKRGKIETSPTDYWVLVLYQFQHRAYDFVIIKPTILLSIYDSLKRGNGTIQSYVWVTSSKPGMCWETRGLNNSDQEKIAIGAYKKTAKKSNTLFERLENDREIGKKYITGNSTRSPMSADEL